MVGVAAENPVALLALQDAKQAHGVQDPPGPADSGHTRADSPADGSQAWKAAGAVSDLEVQVQGRREGAASQGGVKELPGNRGKSLGRGEEALVDADSVDHAAQVLIVPIGVDVGDVAGSGKLF